MIRRVVLVHGWGFGPAVWPRTFVNTIAARFDVVRADLTRVPPAAYPDEILSSCGEDGAALMGWSLGALACVEAVLAAPARVRALAIVGGTARFLRGPDHEGGQTPAALRALRVRLARDPDATLRGFARDMLAPSERDALPEGALDAAVWPDPLRLAEGLDYLATTDLLDHLDRIRIPALVVHGSEDAICPPAGARETARRLPHADLRILVGAGHAPFLTRPHDVAEAIVAFLSDPGGGGSASPTRRIRARFARSAATYDDAASLQREAADALAAAIRGADPKAREILDIGAGTGILTERLAAVFPAARIIASDPAGDLVRRAGRRPELRAIPVVAEAERLPFPDARFDLVASGTALQWTDLERAAAEIARVLRPGGALAFSAVVRGTFPELEAALLAVRGDAGNLWRLRPATDYEDAFARAGLAIAWRDERTTTMRFPSARAFIASLRAIGATSAAGGARPLARTEIDAVLRAYDDAHRTPHGVPATYAILYAIARAGA
ncbi:MAG: alpha/beta fold hydrolase [Planctomycetes bacterium]|nr:alpha/beta fold hydrolase [Planctomycetota bacterium]